MHAIQIRSIIRLILSRIVILNEKSNTSKGNMKLSMYIGCEFAPGQRTCFDFDVEFTDNEMREFARDRKPVATCTIVADS